MLSAQNESLHFLNVIRDKDMVKQRFLSLYKPQCTIMKDFFENIKMTQL